MAQAPPDPITVLHDPSGPVTALAGIKIESKNLDMLISGSENGVISMWDLKCYRQVKTWEAHKGTVIWLGVVEGTTPLVISHCRRDSLVVWNLDAEPIYRMPITHEGFCKCDLRGKTIALPRDKNSLDVIDITQCTSPLLKSSLNMKNDEGAVMAVKLSSETGDFLVAAYESGYVCIWKIAEAIVDREMRVKCMPTCLCLNKEEILLGTSSEVLYVLDWNQLQPLRELTLTNPGLNAIALRPGRFYATAGWDKRLRLFSAAKHKKLCVLILHDSALNALAFAGRFLACGGGDAQISLWDLYNNSP